MSFHFDIDTRDLHCKLCKEVYEPYLDPFVVIKIEDCEITYELCLGCISSFKNCSSCNREFDEPWDIIYLIHSETCYCENCYLNISKEKNDY